MHRKHLAKVNSLMMADIVSSVAGGDEVQADGCKAENVKIKIMSPVLRIMEVSADVSVQAASDCYQPLAAQDDWVGIGSYGRCWRPHAQNIQIIFRQWMEFDPKQWRSYWRDENLFTWRVKTFWLNEDLPDDLAEKVLRIFPDFGGAYLWDADGCCLGVDSVGGTAEFDERFTKWAIRWDHCTSTKTPVTDVATLAAESFDDQGLALAAELKRVAGDKARVFYDFTLKKTDAEIRADGSIKETPRDTDYRQWALDQRKA